MENQLKELRTYFLNKILKGDYEVKKVDLHYLILLIDKKYDFTFWIANSDYGLKQDSSWGAANTIFLGKLTIKKQKQIWSLLKPVVNKYKNDVVLKDKKDQFEKLKKELNL